MTNSADPDQLASLQKPTDLDLHSLLRQGMSCSAREGLTLKRQAKFVADDILNFFFFLFFRENKS